MIVPNIKCPAARARKNASSRPECNPKAMFSKSSKVIPTTEKAITQSIQVRIIPFRLMAMRHVRYFNPSSSSPAEKNMEINVAKKFGGLSALISLK